MSNYRSQILVCAGGACISSGSESLHQALRREISAHGLEEEVAVTRVGCMGLCEKGPIAVVYPDGIFYQKVRAEDAAEIVSEHLHKGRVVERLFFRNPGSQEVIRRIHDIDFFRFQKKFALRNCGRIHPGRIEEYIAANGYTALGKAVCEMTPAEVVDAVKASGLRGRGGAGFPTGLKWGFCAAEKSRVKYVVCNADEGDPGAFMDRSLLEGDPHSLIEGMALCAYAIGARQGYVYVRAEYPLAIQRLETAIEQARALGLLGEKLFGTPFRFDLDIRMGAGAFVCGEETALMHSIEGKRGEPRPKPPFPAQKGLFDKPTVLNNVETFANVPLIVLEGPEAFARYGTKKSKGTKVFALAGDVVNSGLVEVPMGTPLGSVVYDLGGGIPGDKPFKAVQIGGPSGGCIPASLLNTPIAYESLPPLGAIMGSGGLVVMNNDTCMVDIARYFLEFIAHESCGKCTPCRIGTKVMLDLVTRICEGHGTLEDLDRLEELAQTIRETSLCGLGQTAPNPVLSTLRYFRHEYIEHIERKRCRAGVCAELVHSPCVNACPAAVNVPAYLAYVREGRYEDALRVHLRNNPFPSVCGRVCPQWCIEKCRRADLEGPVAIRAVKRFMADQREDYTSLFPAREPDNGLKTAVIGSGPAGLSGAYFLKMLGYAVTVFEKRPKAGGLLRYAIPDYRLPREILDKEIRNLERYGVEIRTGVEIGRDTTLAELRREGFDAFFVSVGAGKEVMPSIEGVDLPGVESGTRFLEQVARGESVAIGREVLVIGGGDAAIDCSRVAQRLGAENVTIVYRRTRKEMPTNPIEIREAETEGVRVEFLANIVRIRRNDEGRLVATLRRMRLGDFDASGRRTPQPIEHADEERTVDTILLAIGHRPDPGMVLRGVDFETAVADGWLKADPETGATPLAGIFAGGDLVTGPATVVEAIGAGQKAAKSIDRMFHAGRLEYPWEKHELPDVAFDPEKELREAPPVEYPLLSPEERFLSVEVEKTIDAEAARAEAGRCLRCDYKV